MNVRGRRLAVLAPAVLGCWVLAGATSAQAAVLRVNTTRDELTRHDGGCSLREAIAAVNAPARRSDCGTASRRTNVVVLRPGRYELTVAPTGSDDNTSGDLNLTARDPLKITGAGTGATVIAANRLGDRAITVTGGARLTLIHLEITGGRAPDPAAATDGSQMRTCPGGEASTSAPAGEGGGAVFNGGSVSLNGVRVVGNRAGAGGAGGNGCRGGRGGSGGGVYNRGTMTVINSTIEGNAAGQGGAGGSGASGPLGTGGQGGRGGAGGSGGGLYSRGQLTVISSTIYGNRGGAGGPGGQGGTGSGPDGAGGPGGAGGGIFSTVGRLRLVNGTLFDNSAGAGGAGGGLAGLGGGGGDGGAIAVAVGPGLLRSSTVADNRVGRGGAGGSSSGRPGSEGRGGGVFVRSSRAADDLRIQNTIVASSVGSGCARTVKSAIANAGHDLSFGDGTCPGRRANPRLGPLRNYGGPAKTMALRPGSAAIGQVPHRHGGCPSVDERGVRRPQEKGCDIGAYEFATPRITILAPFHGSSYQRGERIRARFRCGEGGVASTIAICRGTVTAGHRVRTGQTGRVHFVVTAVDRSGNRARKTIHYRVWEYVNPLRRVSGLAPRRIDLGVDYAGSGPLLAIGRGRVTMASDTDSGPSSCWAISCWPGGGIVVYRLLDGPFAGRYVYVAEHLTVTVRAGQTVRPGEQIATLYAGYPWSEWGWASGPGPEALAMADGHRCTCSDPGGWSTIEGRNMNDLLVRLGAPSGYLQSSVPAQSMPTGWPSWPR